MHSKVSSVQSPVRHALIGLGRIGYLLEDDARREKPCTHAGAIAALQKAGEGSALVGGCDIDEDRRSGFSRRYNVPVFSDVRELMENTRPDILHIATPSDMHWPFVKFAEDAGVRLVVCEKPLAWKKTDAKKILKIHRRAMIARAGHGSREKGPGTLVVVNHERRYGKDYLAAREVVQSHCYGELLSVRANLYFGRTTRLKDMFLHDGTHLVDVISFITDRSWVVKKVFGSMKQRDGSVVLCGRTSGTARSGNIPLTIQIGAGRNYLAFEIECDFEAGRLRLGNGIYEEWQSADSPYYEKYRSLEKVDTPEYTGNTGYFLNMVRDAVACFRDSGRCPISGAEEAMAIYRYL